MRIYYTNKKIFWNNETSDFLEKEKFDEYLGDDVWVEIRSNKSINWSSHYSASFYATDNFDATYFKVVKSNQTYYFFVDDIVFDSSSGKEYSLSLDLYNTYSIHLIEKLKQENPNVYFTRKHTNRYWKKDGNRVMNYLKQPWCFQIPQYLQDVESSMYPSTKKLLKCQKQHKGILWLKEEHGNINDSDYESSSYDLKGCYLYLRIKMSSKVQSPVPISPIAYYPIKEDRTTDFSPNSFGLASKYPSDYLIDMCLLPIPPSTFLYGAKMLEFYGDWKIDDSFDMRLDNSIILFAPLHGYNIYRNLEEPIKFFSINNDEYNINNLENEPLLLSSQCSKYKVVDNELSIPYMFSKENDYINIEDVSFKTLNSYVFGSFYFSITNGLGDNLFEPNSLATSDLKIPFIGNVFTNYLTNNSNSMQTAISLANEQKDLSNKNAGIQMGLGLITNTIGAALGTVTAAMSGGKLGLDAIGSGVGGIISALPNFEMQRQTNIFNYKKVVAEQEALKNDLKNQVGDMKDAYGKGQILKTWNYTKFELPQNEKRRVFSDVYFNGYIVNNVCNFNEYDNRINFNYFELKNVFALCSQYLKLPKSIMTSIAKQLESGIRLWKTINFDYTLNLDNREKSYEIN